MNREGGIWMRDMIDPKQLIRESTVAELCQTAEEFYRNLLGVHAHAPLFDSP